MGFRTAYDSPWTAFLRVTVGVWIALGENMTSEWMWILGGLLSFLAHVGTALIAMRVYWVRRDIIPASLAALSLAFLLTCAMAHLLHALFAGDHFVSLQLLAGFTGVFTVLGLAYHLPRYQGMHREYVERRRLMEVAAQNLPVAMFLADKDLNIIYCDGKALRDAGLDPGVVRGNHVTVFVKNPAILALYRRALKGETGTLRHPGGAGTPHADRVYATKAVPIEMGGDRMLVIVSVDLTEAAALDEVFGQQLRQLRSGSG